MFSQDIESAARQTAELLKHYAARVVFAESCTCGMAAAILGRVPGISNWLCGSAVTYRVASKHQWLGVEPRIIENYSAESPETTRAMALAVLSSTDEADYSASITGDLGPDAGENDGIIHVCIAGRNELTNSKLQVLNEKTLSLKTDLRAARQSEAAVMLLEELRRGIADSHLK